MSGPVEDVCPICLEKPIVPTLSIHDETGYSKQARPVCRTAICEECIYKLQKCPMCNLPMRGYLILPWRIPFDESVQCRQCEWAGRYQEYLTSHTFVHNPDLG